MVCGKFSSQMLISFSEEFTGEMVVKSPHDLNIISSMARSFPQPPSELLNILRIIEFCPACD